MNVQTRPVVLVMMGGESKEHDVSLRSGAAVVKNLPAAGFVPVPVVFGRDGRVALRPADNLQASTAWLPLGEAVTRMAVLQPVCAFIAMHGPFGEDGRVQALCDLMHVPHIGSDAIGSAVAIDKWLAKCVYRAHGIPTPDAELRVAADLDQPGSVEGLLARFGLPCVVKTPRMGSSFGVTIPRSAEALAQSLDDALKLDPRVMIERFRAGRELTVPVLEDPVTGEPRALPVIEIVVKKARDDEFFDYEVKYDPTRSDEVCPAQVPDDVARAAQELGVRAHRALMLSGFSRTDVIWDGDGLWVLETNTIPGLTEASLFPKAVAAAGSTFPEMLRTLVLGAMRRKPGDSHL